MLERIDELLDRRADFAIETTLTSLSYKRTIELVKTKGYSITLLFFWLNDVNLEIGKYDFWKQYSDHVPVIVTFNIIKCLKKKNGDKELQPFLKRKKYES